ncbi:MAG: CDP-alcohol phosphatidyltransferase family protein [Gammaproteobacteria bacterium]
MRFDNKDHYNLPNAVSMLRILMAPILISLALNQQPEWFILIVLFSGFTDVLDGFLARTLNQITELGSHLDSWGDFTIYICMAIGAWLLWPDIVIEEKLSFGIIIVCFTLPVLLGLIKFRTLTSYHTWIVKLAVLLTFIGYVLLFSEIAAWPFHIATVVCVYACIEEILITLVIKHEHADVRSIWQAVKYYHDEN